MPHDFVHEARSLRPGNGLSRIKALFLLMNSSIEQHENELCFNELREADVFPVWRLGTEHGYDRLAATRSPRAWFIADRAHLESSFRGRVDLLAFTPDEISKIPLVLKRLAVGSRKLSKAARSIPELNGSVVRNERLENSWREKAEFIMRSVSDALVLTTIRSTASW